MYVTFVTVLRQFHDYVKPDEAVASQARHSVTTPTAADGDGASLLGDNTLVVNLGIPVIVVLTKVCVCS